MSSPSFGLVVEGAYDTAVYREMIPRLTQGNAEVFFREANGVPNLMKLFPALLRDLEHVRYGQPVHRALVVRDSGGRDTVDLEQAMASRVRGQGFSFPYGPAFVVVRRAVEAWLLADVEAINRTSSRRATGGREIREVVGNLEEIEDPKAMLRRLLTTAKLPIVDTVYSEIAQHINLELLRYRCPSFRAFESKVSGS